LQLTETGYSYYLTRGCIFFKTEKMIKQIKINNFQSHKKAELLLTPGVNVIVGSSDSGKSALIRGLRWLLYNQPRGDAFRSWWGGDTSVEIITDTASVKRVKKNNDDVYIINTENIENSEFRAFRNDVPDEVAAVLNMEDINIQRQLDPPFLIKNSPGEVAQHFNRMARLEKIDTGLKNVQSLIREAEQSIKAKDIELTNVQTKVETYSYIEDVETVITEIETLTDEITDITDEITDITDICSEVISIRKQITETNELLQAEPIINQIEQLHTEIKETRLQQSNIRQIITDLTEINSEIKAIELILPAETLINEIMVLMAEKKEQVKQINQLIEITDGIIDLQDRIKKANKFVAAETLINEILELMQSLEPEKIRVKKLKTIVLNYNETLDGIEFQKKQLRKLENEWVENTPETCPLCGSNISHNHH
jgi:exonuclease SbcC